MFIPPVLEQIWNKPTRLTVLDDGSPLTDVEVRYLQNAIDTYFCILSVEIAPDKRKEAFCWPKENRTVKYSNGTTFIRVYGKYWHKLFPNSTLPQRILDAWATVLKNRTRLNGVDIYATTPGNTSDPLHLNADDPSHWGNSGSCWFRDRGNYAHYSTLRKQLIADGDLYAVVMVEPESGTPIGRIWALRDRRADDVMILFNAYYDGDGVATWEFYQKIATFLNSPILHKVTFHPLGIYINNDKGYLVSKDTVVDSADIAMPIACLDKVEGCSDYTCTNCNNDIDEDEINVVDDEIYCAECVFFCNHCRETRLQSELHRVGRANRCENCLVLCEHCDEWIDPDCSYTDGDNTFCDDCGINCEGCQAVILQKNAVEYDGCQYCDDCAVECDKCGEVHLTDDITKAGQHYYCDDCFSSRPWYTRLDDAIYKNRIRIAQDINRRKSILSYNIRTRYVKIVRPFQIVQSRIAYSIQFGKIREWIDRIP